MSRSAAARAVGQLIQGAAGGATGASTGRPSGAGAVGEIAGRGARQRVEDIKSGAARSTQRQVVATKHFAQTGQKINPASAAAASAPGAAAPTGPNSAAQNAATEAIIRHHLQQGAASR